MRPAHFIGACVFACFAGLCIDQHWYGTGAYFALAAIILSLDAVARRISP